LVVLIEYMRPIAGAGIEKTEPNNLRKISTDCTADTVSLKISRHRLLLQYKLHVVNSSSIRYSYNNIRMLALIDHAHDFTLMRYSIAVITPSLFEGWNTTVKQAKVRLRYISLRNQCIQEAIPFWCRTKLEFPDL